MQVLSFRIRFPYDPGIEFEKVLHGPHAGSTQIGVVSRQQTRGAWTIPSVAPLAMNTTKCPKGHYRPNLTRGE